MREETAERKLPRANALIKMGLPLFLPRHSVQAIILSIMTTRMNTVCKIPARMWPQKGVFQRSAGLSERVTRLETRCKSKVRFFSAQDCLCVSVADKTFLVVIQLSS